MALTPEQTEYYDALDDLFSNKGWQMIVEEATAQIYQYQSDALEQDSWDKVNVLRGKAQQLAELVNLEDTSTMQRTMLEDEDEADADV